MWQTVADMQLKPIRCIPSGQALLLELRFCKLGVSQGCVQHVCWHRQRQGWHASYLHALAAASFRCCTMHFLSYRYAPFGLYRYSVTFWSVSLQRPSTASFWSPPEGSRRTWAASSHHLFTSLVDLRCTAHSVLACREARLPFVRRIDPPRAGTGQHFS